MKQITVFEGIFIGVMLLLLCAPLWTMLAIALPFYLALSSVVSLAALAYFLYLLWRLPHRPGKLLLGVISSLLLLPALVFLSFPALVLLSAGCLWLLRSWLRYRSPLSGICDALLIAFGLAAAVWAALQTGSILISLWCFFLVQALFCLIPRQFSKKAGKRVAIAVCRPEGGFDAAFAAAEQALRRLC